MMMVMIVMPDGYDDDGDEGSPGRMMVVIMIKVIMMMVMIKVMKMIMMITVMMMVRRLMKADEG